jgi:hypothetical protein
LALLIVILALDLAVLTLWAPIVSARAYPVKAVEFGSTESGSPRHPVRLGTEDATLVLLFGLIVSGQIRLRRLNGWQQIPAPVERRAMLGYPDLDTGRV